MKVLVVGDDRVIADLVVFTLRRAGHEAVIANDSISTIRRWTEDKPNLIILDINLPGTPGLEDGFAICKRIRSQSDIPVILLTVRAEEGDIIRGLEAGADDYILKPFSPRQLMARVQAVMRRFQATNTAQRATLSIEGMDFNPKLREVTFSNGSTKSLTQLESRLLESLMINAGQVLTSDDLISDIWGPGGGSAEMLRQLVKRLRAKVEADSTHPKYIHNLPGAGYALRPKR
jgi:two-component system response regulator ResD